MVSNQQDLFELIQRTAGGTLGPEAVAERIAAKLTPPERAHLFKVCLRAYCREVLAGTKALRSPEIAAVEPEQVKPEDHPWRQYPNRDPVPDPVPVAVAVETAPARLAGLGAITFNCAVCREPFVDLDGMLGHRAREGRCYSEFAEVLVVDGG